MRHSLVTITCRNVVAVLTAALLAGCATAAQRQYQAMVTGNQAIIAQAKACGDAIYDSPEAAPLRPHVTRDMREATLAQLSDTSLATKPEIDAILVLHPRLKACEKTVLDQLLNTTPSVVPILAKQYSSADDDTILLIQRKMPWGERVRRGRDRVNETLAALQAEGQRVTSGLERQHESELARRQAALNAISQWAQTQQVINAMNRPVMTNCFGTGSMVNCISH
jgi:hypothetical protein